MGCTYGACPWALIGGDSLKTVSEFIEEHGVRMAYENWHENPNMDDPAWRADHWKVALYVPTRDWVTDDDASMQDIEERTYEHEIFRTEIEGKQYDAFTLYFSKGIGHKGAPPTLDEVLDCLAVDAAGIENATCFEDWAEDLGYDTDSRKAERAYNTVKEQAKKLRSLLGKEAYEELLWEVERE